MSPPTETPFQQRVRLKRDWLLANPADFAWLLERGQTQLDRWCQDPRAHVIVERLQHAGIYSRTTSPSDICATMRRAAQNLETHQRSMLADRDATAPALLEISRIIHRPGVDLAAVRAFVNKFTPP